MYEHNIDYEFNLHVVNWHTKFDALIGSEDLNMLGAKIDYKNNILEIVGLKIPFAFEYTSSQIEYKTICNKFINIPVTIENGEVLLPELQLTKEIIIPESIVTAKQGMCLVPTGQDKPIEINFSERIPVIPTFENELVEPQIEKTKLNIRPLIRLDHLNEEEKKSIYNLCKNFSDIFYFDNCNLSFSNSIKHTIRTINDEPIYVRPFRHPQSMRKEIDSQIRNLLKNKIIRPSISPYSAPVWVVPKKLDSSGNRKFRLVIDYRKLNASTIEDKYPLPRIEEILDNLGKCTYFSTLDLAQGFYQIQMSENSIEKTAFTVNHGHFEYVRMPFGLKNAPSTFQRVMDNIFREYLGKFVMVYMDDIVIFSKSLHDHLLHLKQIFEKLRQYNLKVQLDKSEFLRKEVEFLGHVVTPSGIKPNPNKINCIENFPIPTNTKQIKSFLGLLGYYRRFIPNFAKIVQPLTQCLRKDAKINPLDPDFITCFEHCKQLLTNSPILAYPDFTKPFKLTTDASNVAVGGVLSQSEKPLAYFSRTLNSAERNYSTIEKELLAIIESTKHFRPYLFGRKFTLETDHKPLVWLDKLKEPNSRLIRWRIKLSEYDYEIAYKRGKENHVADALSRIEINFNENNDFDDSESIIPNVDEIPDLTDFESIPPDQPYPVIEQEDIDKILAEFTNPSENEQQLPNSNETIHSTNNDDGKCLPISERPVNIFSNRVIIKLGDKFNVKITQPFNRNHYLITINKNSISENFTDFLKEYITPNLTYCFFFADESLKPIFLNICKEFLNQSIKFFISNILCQDVTLPESQEEIVLEYHEKTHNGITETLNHLNNKFFWPKMRETITKIINTCETCLQAKYERHPYKVPFSGPLLAKRPFEIIHIDTFSFQNSKFLTIIDLFTRYAQAYLLKDGTGLTVLNKLRHYIAHHNIPGKIVCDEGREFKNKTFEEFCKFNKINLHFTTVNNPNSNSPVERFHSTLIEKLRIIKIKNPKDLPSNLVITAVTIYNQSVHTATGYTPFELLYGPYDRSIDLDLDLTIFERYNDKRKQEILPFYDLVYNKNKNKAEQKLAKLNINKEDTPMLIQKDVFIERKRPRKIDPPFQKLIITDQTGNKLQGITEKGNITTAHVKTARRLRKTNLTLQVDDPDDPQPGPSGLQNKA